MMMNGRWKKLSSGKQLLIILAGAVALMSLFGACSNAQYDAELKERAYKRQIQGERNPLVRAEAAWKVAQTNGLNITMEQTDRLANDTCVMFMRDGVESFFDGGYRRFNATLGQAIVLSDIATQSYCVKYADDFKKTLKKVEKSL